MARHERKWGERDKWRTRGDSSGELVVFTVIVLVRTSLAWVCGREKRGEGKEGGLLYGTGESCCLVVNTFWNRFELLVRR